MNRIYILAVACVMGGVTMVALNACGDDDAVIPPGGDDGGGGTSSGASSGTSGTSGGTSGTSGGTSGGTSSGGSDAGDGGGSTSSGSNPGKITCGASECTTGTQLCCRGLNDAGCIAENENCQGAEIECDEKADCPDQGDVCCFNVGAGGGRARCDNNCERRNTACKLATDCPADAGGCIEKTCPIVGKIRTCGPPGLGCN